MMSVKLLIAAVVAATADARSVEGAGAALVTGPPPPICVLRSDQRPAQRPPPSVHRGSTA